MNREEQIAHLKEHQEAFNELHGYERDIEEYFKEYAHLEDLYLDICNDLGIEAKV